MILIAFKALKARVGLLWLFECEPRFPSLTTDSLAWNNRCTELALRTTLPCATAAMRDTCDRCEVPCYHLHTSLAVARYRYVG